MFPVIVALETDIVPKLLNNAPPPCVASAPLAVLFINVVPSTVIVPEPFQNPPPSKAAVFPDTVPPVIILLSPFVICNAPPFPGAEPVALSVKSTSVIVKVPPPELTSIPPPALFDMLPDNVEAVTVSVPISLKIPPPEPEAPSAMFPVIVALATVIVPKLLNNAPPPSVAVAPLAVFVVKVVPSTDIIPEPFHNPPPSDDAVFPDTAPPVIVELLGPVI